MKRFLFKSLLFIAPLLVLFGIFERALRRMPTSYSVKRRALESVLDRVEVLVVGPSHAEQAIYPRLFRRPGFNLALPAQDLYYDAQLVERYLPRASRLRLVIITVSYISLEYRMSDALEPWRTHFYSIFFGIRNESWRRRFLLPDKSVLALYGPEKALEYARSGFRVELGAGDLDGDGSRRVASTLSDRRAAADGAARFALDRREIMRAENFAPNVAVLDKLLTTIKQHGVRPVLVTLPVLPAYSSRAHQTASWNRMQTVLSSLARTHQVPYFNFFDDRRFVTADFANSDHMNQDGALKMSRIVDNEIVGALLH